MPDSADVSQVAGLDAYDVTLKRFQKGELAYRETILGGCVKIGDCDKNPLDILHVECLTSSQSF
jgi:hypothetical protein